MKTKDLKFGDLIKISKCNFVGNFLSHNNIPNNSFYVIVVENKFYFLKILYKGKIASRFYVSDSDTIDFVSFEKINL